MTLAATNHFQRHLHSALMLLIFLSFVTFVYFSTTSEKLVHLLVGVGAAIIVFVTHNLYSREATRFNLIMDNVQDIICQVDSRAIFRFVSKAAFTTTGYQSDMFLNQPAETFMSLLHPDDLPRVQEQWRETVPTRVEYRLRHAQGHYIWLETVCNSIFSSDGSPAGIIFSIRDITRQHQIREALRLSEERLATNFLVSPVP